MARNLKTRSDMQSTLPEKNSNPLAIFDLASIASDLLANADDAEFVRAKAAELAAIAEAAFDLMADLGARMEKEDYSI